MDKTALLTVGSTEFNSLVESFLSPDLINLLQSHFDINRIYAQIGHSRLPQGFKIGLQVVAGIEVEVVRFTDQLEEKVGVAPLVVSHAGAGSILSFLRPVEPPTSSSTSISPTSTHGTQQRQPRRLVIVPNDTLMDRHQSDLADEMEKLSSEAIVCRNASDLLPTLRRISDEQNDSSPKNNIQPPPFDRYKVQRIIDQTLGYV